MFIFSFLLALLFFYNLACVLIYSITLFRSATVDSNLFSRYFGQCPVLTAEGRTHPVKNYFLEDIYEYINYNLASDAPAALRYETSAFDKVLKHFYSRMWLLFSYCFAALFYLISPNLWFDLCFFWNVPYCAYAHSNSVIMTMYTSLSTSFYSSVTLFGTWKRNKNWEQRRCPMGRLLGVLQIIYTHIS